MTSLKIFIAILTIISASDNVTNKKFTDWMDKVNLQLISKGEEYLKLPFYESAKRTTELLKIISFLLFVSFMIVASMSKYLNALSRLTTFLSIICFSIFILVSFLGKPYSHKADMKLDLQKRAIRALFCLITLGVFIYVLYKIMPIKTMTSMENFITPYNLYISVIIISMMFIYIFNRLFQTSINWLLLKLLACFIKMSDILNPKKPIKSITFYLLIFPSLYYIFFG